MPTIYDQSGVGLEGTNLAPKVKKVKNSSCHCLHIKLSPDVGMLIDTKSCSWLSAETEPEMKAHPHSFKYNFKAIVPGFRLSYHFTPFLTK